MSMLFIRARATTFTSCDQGAEYQRPEAALALGIQGAVAMLADEVGRDAQSSAIEVSIEAEDGKQILCSIVTLSVCPLLPRRPFVQSADMWD